MKKVFLIDDDPIMCELMKKKLGARDIKMDFVSSIPHLYRKKGIEDTDLFLVDYDLYDGTGVEVIEYLGERFPDTDVMMISSTDRGCETAASFPNFKGFITKWQNLDEIVHDIIHNPSSVTEAA